MATRGKAPAKESVDEPDAAEASPLGVVSVNNHDNVTSTGLSPMPAAGVETHADHWAQNPVIRVQTPTDPVVMSVSWLSNAQTKVVTPAEDDSEPASSAVAETK